MIRLLLLWALAATANAAAPTACDVRTFGAHGDGRTVETAAIQRAIDACATLRFPPGRYVSGTLMLHSNLTLQLDAGATLAGSTRIADYRTGASIGLGQDEGYDKAGEGGNAGLLVGRNMHDVQLIGPGTIDGSGSAFMTGAAHVPPDYAPSAVRDAPAFEAAMRDTSYGPVEPVRGGRPGVLILFFHAQNLTVRDLHVVNTPNWTLVLQDVQHGIVTGLSVLNTMVIPNADGVDCNQCRDVHFANGLIHSGDDCFALFESEDVTVTGFTLESRSAAIRLESSRRVVFSGLAIDSNRGIAVFASNRRSAGTDGVLFTNIAMRTRLIPGHWWGKGEPIYLSIQPCLAGRPCVGGGVRNVTFAAIDADAQAGIIIEGAPGRDAVDIELRDVQLRMAAPTAAMAAAVGGNFDRRWTAASVSGAIVRHDIPAIWVRHVAGLTVPQRRRRVGAGVARLHQRRIGRGPVCRSDARRFPRDRPGPRHRQRHSP